MLWSIVGALVLGAALAAAAYWALHRYIKTSTMPAAPIDLTKLSLTVVAGVGGVVALVVAYRRQRDLEQGRFVERFGAAAAQLGSADVAVRIAGVYAMAGAADDSRGLRRQQCIDVLCGYLRLPYAPGLGINHQTKEVLKYPGPDIGPEREQHFEYRQNDSEVRKTIVNVIADHLRPTAEDSWSANTFDFRDAYLEDAFFYDVTFSGTVLFSGATFSGTTSFLEATFLGTTRFEGATFPGSTSFEGATFPGSTSFDGATFPGSTSFDGATFPGSTSFDGATFRGTTWFDNATFPGTTSFREATFSGFAGRTSFRAATFRGITWFYGGTFSSRVTFEEVDFGTKLILFGGPKRWGPPEPVFDWSADPNLKPANVVPQDWPPGLSELRWI